jgi:zinc-binding alcohol dehydrogenase/oxidoreductase
MHAGVVLPEGPDAVRFATDVPDPRPGPGQVRVRISHAALNANDLMIVADRASLGAPAVIGSDGVGQVDEVGEGIEAAGVGDHVVILPSLHWGDDVDRPSPAFEILGHPTPGTHAQYTVVPADNVRPVPAAWSPADAAALPLAGLTAWRALTTRGRLAEGEALLVTGASGGVATFLIALGRDLGATVRRGES